MEAALNIELIRFFLALERTRNFTRAAEECYVSQSSFSKQIKKLESELGIKLFDRDKRGVNLTTEGKVFSYYAIQILDLYRKMQTDICRQRHTELLTIRVASIPVILQYQLMPIFEKFECTHKNIKFNIKEEDPDEVIKAYRNKTADIAILRNSGSLPNDLLVHNFLSDELIVVTHKNHDLAKHQIIKIKDLVEEKIIMGRLGQVNEIIVTEFKRAGIRPKITFYNFRFRTVLDMVSKDEGISLAMKRMIDLRSFPGLRILSLDHKPSYALCMALNESIDTTCADSFLQFITSECTSESSKKF